MKAQASIEMFTTVSLALAFLVPISLLLFVISSQNFEEVSKAQADVTVKKIANTINSIYLEGDGAKGELLVNLPSNTKSLNISNGEVKVVLSIGGGFSEASYPLITNNLKQEFNTDKKGLFWIKIKNIENQVSIDDYE